MPEAAAEDASRWQVSIDLGTVGRTFALPEFEPEAWLAARAKGLGERTKVSQGARYLYAEIIASAGATLTLSDSKAGKRYAFELSKVVPGSELASDRGRRKHRDR